MQADNSFKRLFLISDSFITMLPCDEASLQSGQLYMMVLLLLKQYVLIHSTIVPQNYSFTLQPTGTLVGSQIQERVIHRARSLGSGTSLQQITLKLTFWPCNRQQVHPASAACYLSSFCSSCWTVLSPSSRVSCLFSCVSVA